MPQMIRASLVLLLACVACQGPSNGPTVIAAPNPDTFAAVSPVLEVHCGTLDCHGTSWRNLRVYGIDGVRLDPAGVTGEMATTPDEVLATYESLVTTQPEVLTQIVNDRGARAERWLVLTKGRGVEHHKGGKRLSAGDDADRCITTWLAGATDTAACELGADLGPPGGEGF